MYAYWVEAYFVRLGPYLVGILIFWALLKIHRTISLPRRARRGPACERCGYSAQGLNALACPECGADLRRHGIITPRMEAKRRGSLASTIVVWTLLCGTLTYLGDAFARDYQNYRVQSAAVNAVSTWRCRLVPLSGNYQSADLIFDSDWSSIAGDLEMTLTLLDGSTRTLTLDPASRQILDPEPVAPPWGRDTIPDLFTAAGLDASDPTISREADEITTTVELALMSPSFVNSGFQRLHSSRVTSLNPPPTPVYHVFLFQSLLIELAAYAVALVLYILGIAYIVHRRQQLLCHALPSPP